MLMGTNHISGTAEAIMVTFCTQVGYVKSQYTDDKSPLKGRGQSRNPLNFGVPNDISGTAEATIVKFCKQVDYIKSQSTA